MPVTQLPLYRVLAEHLKPVLQIRALELYELRTKTTPNHAMVDHLVEVGMKALKSEVEQAHDLQMSAQTATKAVVERVLDV